MKIAIIVLAAILAVPAASATWRGYGTYEPDNYYDSPTLAYTDPPGTATGPAQGAVYFNGFHLSGLVANPNVGATGTRNDAYGTRSYQAMLGSWTDCNQDGYVGIAESAMDEYPAVLLSPDQLSICPVGTANNGGGWVTELRVIGYEYKDAVLASRASYDPRMIVDNTVLVWADEGLYSDLIATQGGSCPVSPLPRGTYHSVGGLLNVADCVPGHRVEHRYNQVLVGGDQSILGGNTQHIPGLADFAGDPANLRAFADTNRNDWTTGGLGSIQTFGEEPSSGSAATWDCSSTAPVWAGAAGDQLNTVNQGQLKPRNREIRFGGENGENRNTDFNKQGPRLIAPTLTPGADPARQGPATLNATNEAQLGDCNTADDSGHDFYGALNEGNNNPGGSAAPVKNKPDHQFNFSAEHRGEAPGVSNDEADLKGPNNALVGAGVISPTQPSCLGLYLLEEAACPQSFWFANDLLLGTRPGTRLDDEAGRIGLAGRHQVTFYARVSASDGALPGGSGVYGSYQCPVFGPGAVGGGWSCDTTKWYLNVDGVTYSTPIGGYKGLRPYPGTTYNLRDVDCDDGQIVAGLPVYAGAGSFDKPCDVQ